MDYISYLRVSTEKQGEIGLGIQAQRDAVKRTFGEPATEFVEVESGGKNNRPKLKEAIAQCKAIGATLVIAKIDRLSRNVAFIANLMESGIQFKAADLPNLDHLTVHILAAVAQKERELISARVKAALTVLKKNGVKLGSPSCKDDILINRSKRIYSKPDPSKVETLKILKQAGQPMAKLQETAQHLFGRSLSAVTIYSYLKL